MRWRVKDWLCVNRSLFITVLVLTLVGCMNPYGLNLKTLDFDAEQSLGVIQFSDPKLFPREYLINERRDELSFLTNALDECNTAYVAPELIRELKVIQTISAGIGLEFDPSEGANFERSRELAEIKQDIAKTRTEMQLAQIRREAELLKDQLMTQKEIDMSSLQNNADPEDVNSGVSAPSAADINSLFDNVKTIEKNLRNDTDSKVTPLGKSGGDAGPIDTFNYRKSCRDTVKNAINKTKLDELHDKDGNTLVRVQFRATVLPGNKEYEDTLGILRMEVLPPKFESSNSDFAVQIYRTWLKYVNRNINLLPRGSDNLANQQIRTEPRFADLHLYDYFDFRYFEVPKFNSEKEYISPAAKDCKGFRSKERTPNNCWYLRVALPTGSADHLDILSSAQDILTEQLYGAVLGIHTNKISFDTTCNVDALNDEITFPQLNHPEIDGKTARQAVYTANQVILNRRSWRLFVRAIPDSVWESLNFFVESREAEQDRLLSAAEDVLQAVGAGENKCQIDGIQVPSSFFNVIQASKHRIAVYDVGPAERVQPISTAARAADALSLASSVAGVLPTFGLGSSGNFAFLRSAAGKADALELAPIVVGFTEPANFPEIKKSSNNNESDTETSNTKTAASFGWLLGPKAVLDPEEQELRFVHPIKPYDLYADLSLPGWWTHFDLKAFTAWAPDWRSDDLSGTTMDTSKAKLTRTVNVPMRLNAVDMEGLTMLLLREAELPRLDAPRVEKVEPSKINTCEGEIDLLITGHNVWRASMVHIGGQAIDNEGNPENATTAIRILPDMSGIIAKVTFSKLPNQYDADSILTVWTPNGRDSWPIRISETLETNRSEKDCNTINFATSIKPKDPKIQELRPAQVSMCSGMVNFQLLGNNLTRNPKINIGGALAEDVTPLPSNKGVSFKLDISKIPVLGDQPAMVSLLTEGGEDLEELRFFDVRKIGFGQNNECVMLAEKIRPTIKKITPDSVNVCREKVSFRVHGSNLGNATDARLGGVEGSIPVELSPHDGTLLRFEFDFNKYRRAFSELMQISAEVRTQHGLATYEVSLIGNADKCTQTDRDTKP